MIFSFIAPVATTYFILRNQKKIIKKEIKRKIIAGIAKEELVLLKFTEQEKQEKLKWEHSKEFEFNGNMYDVVDNEIKGDTTIYWCWLDDEETKLNKQLSELVSRALGNNPKNKENQKRLNNFFNSLFYSESKEKIAISVLEINCKCVYTQKFIQFVSYSPLDPPPKMVFTNNFV